MSNIAVIDVRAPALQMAESELVKVLQSSLYPGAAPESIQLVLGYCKAAGYDPMQKPVHIVPMWDNRSGQMRDVVMPGVGLYRTQAARTGQFAGMTEPEFGPDVTELIGGASVTYPQWCRVTVKRQMANGSIAEFTAREFWKENYAVRGGKEKSIAPNAMWARRVYGQLAKCAQAQALRLAFPEATGAEATADEVEGKEINVDAIDVTPTRLPPARETWSQADFDAALPKWSNVVATGRKTPDELIALASSRRDLTDAQRATLSGLKSAERHIDDQAMQEILAIAADATISAAEIRKHFTFPDGNFPESKVADILAFIANPAEAA